jgi:hypothetical protein
MMNGLGRDAVDRFIRVNYQIRTVSELVLLC